MTTTTPSPPVNHPFSFFVNNTSTTEVMVYSTFNPTSTNASPPSQSADDYIPVYTLLGTVASGQTQTLTCPLTLGRIVVVRSSDQFPMALQVMAFWDTTEKRTISVTDSDLALCQQAFALYKEVSANPFEPLALQFHDILINTSALQVPATIAAFLNSNGYSNVTYSMFSMVSYWVTCTLYAFPATYYVYEPQSNNQSGFILPTQPIGLITVSNGTAVYQLTGANSNLSLTQFNSQLSADANSPTNVSLTGILRSLTWENQPSEMAYCYVGTINGIQVIVQPYQNPPLPWWVMAYDMAYLSFELVQLGMALEMASSLLSSSTSGISWLTANQGNLKEAFIRDVRDWANRQGDQADPSSGEGDDVDPSNTDVDTDSDTDDDTDVDVDVDVDIDVDIDIDVDVDFFAVVDVDIDVDVDVDNDTDTDTVTDTDTDIDIDTDVNVEEGFFTTLLRGLGNWLMKKGIPALMEQLEIQFSMMATQKILAIWKQQDEQGLADLQPRQTTGLGFLLNYMLNPKVAIATRWNTFADYVQQTSTGDSSNDNTAIQVVLVSVLAVNNAAADQEANNWRWSVNDENALISQLAQSTGSNTYQAFPILGTYTYNNQTLPVKVGCQMAIKYLKQTAS
jgi:hypothetical protein